MKLKTKELTTCALFAALIAVGAFIKIDIPLPMYTMHFTLQWFFVLMAGFLLGAKLASLSVIVYLCIGLVAYYTVGAIYFYCMKNFYAATPVSWGIVIVDYCLITVAPDFILCVSAAVFSAKLHPVFAGILNGYSVKNKVENKA